MDERALQLAEDLVSARYIEAGRESLHANARTLRSLLAQRRCPEVGLSDAAIELLLRQLAMMDTNNFAHHVGGGEREGRVVSALVRQRHLNFSHGIGRSGDLTSEQPKAAGSSLLYRLTNLMMLDLIREAGAPSTAAAVVVPMATGMTLALVLRCVAKARAAEAQANAASFSSGAPQYVIWPRIDQKTALKCIDAAGLVPVPVALRAVAPLSARAAHAGPAAAAAAPPREGDEGAAPSHSQAAISPTPDSSAVPPYFLECHVDDIAAAVEAVGGPSRVVCVLSTTSCFAPRVPDNTVAMAQYCRVAGVPYVVNNAYGVQSRRIMVRLDAAQRLGRVDYVVQSGDKNFLVPVGGSVISCSDAARCQAAAALYAGRASMSPVLDLCITALSLGRRGMHALWAERYECRALLLRRLRAFARERGEVLLADDGDEEVEACGEAERNASGGASTAATGRRAPRRPTAPQPRNDISFAVTMRTYGRDPGGKDAGGGDAGEAWAAARALGARIFRSAVTGPRVVTPAPSTRTTIAGCTFVNYGMHQDELPPCPLLVIACGIGMTLPEVESLVARLQELWPVVGAKARVQS